VEIIIKGFGTKKKKKEKELSFLPVCPVWNKDEWGRNGRGSP
jgi:hypothetical protein